MGMSVLGTSLKMPYNVVSNQISLFVAIGILLSFLCIICVAIYLIFKHIKLIKKSHEEKISTLEKEYAAIEKQKKDLRNFRERYRLASEGAEVGIWDYDFRKRNLYVSTKGQHILGIDGSKKKITVDLIASYIMEEDVEKCRKSIEEHINGDTDILQCQLRMRIVKDKYVWLSLRGRVQFDDDHKPIRMAGSISNIDKEKLAEERVIELAYYDFLTRLPNKYYFQERISNLVKDQTCKSFALLFMDIDNLKAINDSLGYQKGDLVIQMVTQILEQYTGEDQELFKFGGDEFIILYRNIENQEAVEVYLKEILAHFQKPFDIEGLGFSITLSVGVAIYPIDGETEDLLLKHADTALNHIKQKGKNGFEIFSFELNQNLNQRLQMERELRRAVLAEEMILYYQPKYDIKKHSIVGYEALLRWNHPEKGIISPMEFIPLAEETGIIIPLGEWVIKEAVAQLGRWHKDGHDHLTISINLSAKQLKEIHLIRFFRQIIEQSDIDPSFLELEITETAALYDINYAITILNELKSLGLKVSLDDFGTGYSSLNYLTSLPVDILKIDKSFLANNQDHQNIEIIKSVIALAHACDMDVVAEGVETVEQLEFLEAHQCDLMQGYYFSKPLPHHEAIALNKVSD